MTYIKPQQLSGRFDGQGDEFLRFFQIIKNVDLNLEDFLLNKNNKSITFLGSAIDEGVLRNKGRIGAKKGPDAIRQAMMNFAVHFKKEELELFDCGNVEVDKENNLEKAQNEIGEIICKILENNSTPILLGGGHDLTYSNYLGIEKFLKKSNQSQKKLGIINFDAHFDIRPIDEKNGTTSGTSIYNIASDCKKNSKHFSHLALGIQESANTKFLFNLAKDFDVDYVLGDDFNFLNREKILKKLQEFIDKNDLIYFTICMDVFAACFAPGVSAPSHNGIIPNEFFYEIFNLIINSKKVISIDFAETNPEFDIDNRTAKLAASLIFKIIKNVTS